jgi:hypothetical protein
MYEWRRMPRTAPSKRFQTLSGHDVLVAHADLDLRTCRDLVARRLDVIPEMVHLVKEEAEDVYCVVVCATFKILCSACHRRIECTCEEAELACRCKLSQTWGDAAPPPGPLLFEEELCIHCHEEREMKAHWCDSEYCVVCGEDWSHPGVSYNLRRFPKRRQPKKAAIDWIQEDRDDPHLYPL